MTGLQLHRELLLGGQLWLIMLISWAPAERSLPRVPGATGGVAGLQAKAGR